MGKKEPHLEMIQLNESDSLPQLLLLKEIMVRLMNTGKAELLLYPTITESSRRH